MVRTTDFDAFITDILVNRKYSIAERNEKLCAWRKHPMARIAHPEPSHFVPMFVAAGAGLDDLSVKVYDEFPFVRVRPLSPSLSLSLPPARSPEKVLKLMIVLCILCLCSGSCSPPGFCPVTRLD